MAKTKTATVVPFQVSHEQALAEIHAGLVAQGYTALKALIVMREAGIGSSDASWAALWGARWQAAQESK